MLRPGDVTLGKIPSSSRKGGISTKLAHCHHSIWIDGAVFSSELEDEPDFSSNLTGIHVHFGTLDFLGKRFQDLTLAREQQRWRVAFHFSWRRNRWKCRLGSVCHGKVLARLHRLTIPVRSPSRPGSRCQNGSKAKPCRHWMWSSILSLSATSSSAGWNWCWAGMNKLACRETACYHPDSSIIFRGLWQSRSGPPRRACGYRAGSQ